MNARVVCGWLLAGLFAAGCGGRLAVVTFAPDNQDLAKSLKAAVESKNMKAVQGAVAAADRRDPAKMMADEKAAFKWVSETCEKGDWDKAKDYLDKCLASGK